LPTACFHYANVSGDADLGARKWMLAASPFDYKFSTVNFYDSNQDEYGFLTTIGERF